jgi:NADH-quinone oxidoreductase subunit N
MNPLLQVLWPEFVLAAVACALLLLGTSNKPAVRRAAPVLAFATLLLVFALEFLSVPHLLSAAADTVRGSPLSHYVKLLTCGAGALLILVAWPSNADVTGNPALNFGQGSGEFFGLMLFSLCGICLIADANDVMLLFLAIELTSIPTYVMVAISRPLPVAQEAGVKYFFLGAMAAAVMLFGFSYLYGTTGLTSLSDIGAAFAHTLDRSAAAGGAMTLDAWQMLAVVMLIAGFAFKMAAVPLHFYAGDVYEGAATPVTAFLAFVPKTSGFVALIKILFLAGGNSFLAPHPIPRLLWVLAVLTMSVGNVLALLQVNVKRVLAYSSVAHSGYMLVGIAALVATTSQAVRTSALQGVLFYLAAYGIMNVGAFAVLTLLHPRKSALATSAETFEDLAGQGRRHVALGVSMAIICFSLTGIPLTVGFFGKVYLVTPALAAAAADPAIKTQMVWLAVILMVNAAVSAGYYLRIVAALFLRTEPVIHGAAEAHGAGQPHGLQGLHGAHGSPATAPAVLDPTSLAEGYYSGPILSCVVLSVLGTLFFGIYLPATSDLAAGATAAAHLNAAMMPASTAQVEPFKALPAPAAFHAGGEAAAVSLQK